MARSRAVSSPIGSVLRLRAFRCPGNSPARRQHDVLSCRRQGLPGLSRRWHPRPSCTPHGPVILDGEAGRGSRRRGEREPRPRCLDAAEARGRAPGRPGWRPDARRPRAIGGRAPARAHPAAGAPAGGRARNVGAAARRVRTLPAVTLSDTSVRENARTPADLAPLLGRLADRPCRTRTGVLLYRPGHLRTGPRSSVG